MAKSKKSTVNPLGGFLADLSTGLLDTISGSTNSVSNVIKHVSGKIISAEQVLTILEELKINQSQYTTEKNVENLIAGFLGNFFDVHRQYNIGGFLGLKIDIDLNETVGIEIKLAKELRINSKSCGVTWIKHITALADKERILHSLPL